MKTWDSIFIYSLSDLGKSSDGTTNINSNKLAINIEILSFENDRLFDISKIRKSGVGAHTLDALIKYGKLLIGIEFTNADKVKKFNTGKNRTLGEKITCSVLNEGKIDIRYDEVWFVSPDPKVFKTAEEVKKDTNQWLNEYSREYNKDVSKFKERCKELVYKHISINEFNDLNDDLFSFPNDAHDSIVSYARGKCKDISKVFIKQ